MKHLTGLFFFLGISIQLFAQGQQKVDWYYCIDGYNDTDFADLTVDKKGNTYVAANYMAELKIPELKLTLPYPGHMMNGMIMKLDNKGKPLWAQALHSTADCRIRDITQAPNGDLLITGFCCGITSFPSTSGGDLKLGTAKAPNQYHDNCYVFVARYSVDGKRIWAKILGNGWGEGRSVAVNSKNEIYWSFYFRGILKEDEKLIDTFKSESSSTYRSVVLKLDGTGKILKVVAANHEIESANDRLATALAVDQQDNLIMYGTFNKRLLFTPKDSLTNDPYYESRDAFIAKYSSDDVFQWSRKIGGRNMQHIYDLVFDDLNRIYITGSYSFECIISNGINLVQKSNYEWKSGDSFFYCRFKPDGTLDYADYHQQKDYNSGCSGRSLALDKNGYLYNCGSFNDTLDFNGRQPEIYSHDSFDQDGFITCWKQDTLIDLQRNITTEKGWAYTGKIEITGTTAVIGGLYYGTHNVVLPGGKKATFSQRDYGRGTFIVGMTLPDRKPFTEVKDSVAPHLLAMKPLLQCSSPEKEPEPDVWIQTAKAVIPIPAADSVSTSAPSGIQLEPSNCGVRLVNCEATLFPNPTDGKTTLQLKGVEGVTTIDIVSERGELLLSQQVVVSEDARTFEFDLSNCTPAVYFVCVTHQGFKKALRVVRK